MNQNIAAKEDSKLLAQSKAIQAGLSKITKETFINKMVESVQGQKRQFYSGVNYEQGKIINARC